MDTIDVVPSNEDHQANHEEADVVAGEESHQDPGNRVRIIGAAYPEFVQPNEEHNRFMAQSSRGNPLLRHEGDFKVPAVICSYEYIEWLREKGASFMKTRNRNLICKLLVKLAEDLKALPPGIECPPLDHSADRLPWMDRLILEMSTVEENVSSEVRDSGIFVLTNQPYAKLLRELAVAIMEQGAHPNPLFQGELPVNISIKEYVEWLESNTLFIGQILMSQPGSPRNIAANEIHSASRILMKLADDLECLPPGNRSHLRYDIKIPFWRVYWKALIADMKTVEASCLPEIRYSGVYVLTTWPYKEFLRALAAILNNVPGFMDIVHEIQSEYWLYRRL